MVIRLERKGESHDARQREWFGFSGADTGETRLPQGHRDGGSVCGGERLHDSGVQSVGDGGGWASIGRGRMDRLDLPGLYLMVLEAGIRCERKGH